MHFGQNYKLSWYTMSENEDDYIQVKLVTGEKHGRDIWV